MIKEIFLFCKLLSISYDLIIKELYRRDSFDQDETALNWKIRTESYTDPNVPKLSRTRNHVYPVSMKYIEVKLSVS